MCKRVPCEINSKTHSGTQLIVYDTREKNWNKVCKIAKI